jgi:hypothetical protein
MRRIPSPTTSNTSLISPRPNLNCSIPLIQVCRLAFLHIFIFSPPVQLAPPPEEGGDDPFLEPSTSKWKPKPNSKTAKSAAVPSKIPMAKGPSVSTSQRLASAKIRLTVAPTSRTKITSTTRPIQSATRTTTGTMNRPITVPRSASVTKPSLTTRPVKSSATARAISPRKQVVPRTATSRVQPMKPLIPVQKPNATTGSSSTARAGVISRPPFGAATRKAGTPTSTFAGKKPVGPALKEKEDVLILKFDVQGEVEEFQFNV